jgi:RNA polymerase sigma-70 factor (ECF subfamily)
VAELLGTTVASVNSALQRARATLASTDLDAAGPAPTDPDQQAMLARYVDAFERYDMESLVALLHEDATFSMPPYALWLEGPVQVEAWLLGQGFGCKGSRLLPTRANGCPAFGSYKPAGPGLHLPFAIQVLDISGGKITAWQNFLYPELFGLFGLPDRIEG